jgi:peptide/nickel transport system permease protein
MKYKLIFSILIFLCWGGIILTGWIGDLHPEQIHLDKILESPSAVSWLGYDDLGRPLRDRLISGAQVSFLVAFLVSAVSLVVGTLIGVVAGYRGGWVDRLVVRIIDIFMAFPGILLAIAMAAVMGAGMINVVIALSVTGWVGYARLTRAQAMTLRQREHVLAARALGVSDLFIVLRHILPLLSATLIVEATFGFAGIIIGEAGLSYLGLGVQPPAASWGSMIRDGSQYLLVAPHMVLVPGVALAMVVLAINLFGDWLRDYLDVKERLR